MSFTPQEIKQVDKQTLGLVWNDGHESNYQVRNLRLACRCANCIDEWTREKILKEADVPDTIHPKRIESIGRYAFKITWSDGHDTGFYTFDQLRDLCECSRCRKA